MCRKSPASFFFGLAVGGRVGPSPSTIRPSAASGPCVKRQNRFSPTAYGPRAGHLSVQCFTLHHPKQGRQGLSFVVEGVTSSRPSRHPKSGMSSSARHSASSIAFRSRMGASTRGIALGSPHSSVRLHTSVWEESPPRFDGVQLTVVNSTSKASVLQQELSSLLQKGAIEEIPQSEIKQGFFSRYFLVPKRDGGLRPILDLRCLNLSLYKGKFKMLMMKTIMSQIQGGDWFVTIDLKDAYSHIQVVQRHRKFLRFAFWKEGLPIQGPSPRPGLGTENVHKVHGCCTGPLEVSGHSCSELLRRLSHSFLHSGVRMGAIHRHHMITTDASMTGWGVVFEGRPARWQWTGEFISWHINCLDLRAVFLALMHFLPVLGKHHIIVRTDNMVVVSHINRQGGSRSRTLDRLVRCLLLWSQGKFLSLRAVHVPRILIFASDFL